MDRFGEENSAYYFDGDNQFIQTASSSTLEVSNTVSFSFWFKCSDMAIGSRRSIVVQGTVFDTDNNWEVMIEPDTT